MRSSGIEGCGLAPGEGVSRSPRLLRERALHAAGNEVAAAVTLSHPANKKRRRYQRRFWCTHAWTGPLRLALAGATRSGTAGGDTCSRSVDQDIPRPPRRFDLPQSRPSGALLTIVPNIGRELPVITVFFPNHNILASHILWVWALSLQAEGSDLTCCGGAEWLDVKGC